MPALSAKKITHIVHTFAQYPRASLGSGPSMSVAIRSTALRGVANESAKRRHKEPLITVGRKRGARTKEAFVRPAPVTMPTATRYGMSDL
jgi:hypothetical protein